MTMGFENLKKLMGWCPNAKKSEPQYPTYPEYLKVNPKIGGGDSGNSENPSWFRKLSSRILLIDSFLTLAYLHVLVHFGINGEFFFAGLFISVSYFVLYWKKQLHRYDAIAEKLFVDYSEKKSPYLKAVRISTLIILVFYVAFVSLIFMNMIWGIQARELISFFAGWLIPLWLVYLQILYWERNNQKTIYFDISYGKWKKSYIVREKK